MNIERLNDLALQFVAELRSSKELQDHISEHHVRSERAQRMLVPDRIRDLTEDDLRELFFDTDAFGF